ncbi:MAG: hypothetical protein M1113_02105 [Candidatus Thermoplasmatota archaeon]|nr:hypothetical protein [Candidatus Thermoplasmatota archaeon]
MILEFHFRGVMKYRPLVSIVSKLSSSMKPLSMKNRVPGGTSFCDDLSVSISATDPGSGEAQDHPDHGKRHVAVAVAELRHVYAR